MNNSNLMVSVIMPVYNSAKYLGEAIESILNQSFADFEFIIIDDGSTDNSLEIIHRFADIDSRIRVIINENNLGIGRSLNIAIASANGKYIARMDADDISALNRLEIQIEYLEKNPIIALLGSWANIIDGYGKSISQWKMPSYNKFIKWILMWKNAFIHTSVIFRKEIFTKRFKYNETLITAQDYDLWERIAQKFQVDNLPIPLVSHRIHLESVSKMKETEQLKNHIHISLRALDRIKGISPKKDTIEFIRNPFDDKQELEDAKELILLAQKMFLNFSNEKLARRYVKRDASQRLGKLIIDSGFSPNLGSWELFYYQKKYQIGKFINGRKGIFLDSFTKKSS